MRRQILSFLHFPLDFSSFSLYNLALVSDIQKWR